MPQRENKIANVTGASSGIGMIIALVFALERAEVTVDYYAHKSDEAEAIAARGC